MEHLPALVVVIPLLGACGAVLIRNALVARWYATVVAWVVFTCALLLFARVQSEGVISYALGGWAAPWGIEYRVDVLGSAMLCLVSAMAAVVLPWGPSHAATTIQSERRHLFYAAFLLCLTGLMGISVTGDAFNVFVFLEIASLSTYVLIAMGDDRRALTAAFTYLVIGTIGGTFYLIGIGLLYVHTGSLNMADLATLLPAVRHTRTVHVALGFVLVGLAIKIAVFPLHQWLPNAYTFAPNKVSAFIASTFTKVMLYTFIRMVFTVFGGAFVLGQLHLGSVLIPLSIAGIYVGTIVAIYEPNCKRMLAYSSIAQLGYMMLGISLYSLTGLTAGIVHLFNHALMKGGLFLVVGSIAWQIGSVKIEDMRGLGKQMPWTMAAFVVGGLSLIGVPLTVGFISKFYLVLAALQQQRFVVAGLVVISSILSILYIGKVVEAAYLHPRPAGAPQVKEAPLGMLLPAWLLVGASVVFGIYTPWTAGVARMAAAQLLGGAG